MTTTNERIITSSQEQAVATWVTYLNQVRLDTLLQRLDEQDLNLESALYELGELKAFIGNPEHILGSELTKHGEIAEHMQVNIANARNAIQGLQKEYSFDGVKRTAPEDYLKNGLQVQSKFYNGLRQTFFNEHGLKDHLKTYPYFVENGGSYDIPKDQFEKMVDLLDKYKNSPSQLSKSDFQLAKKINEFLETNQLVPGKEITPTVVNYSDVQKGIAAETVKHEEQHIKEEDYNNRKAAYDASKPTLKEGIKVASLSVVVEGGVGFCIAVANKRKEKSFAEFTEGDWIEIGIDTGKSTVKGGIRGSAIYLMTNFTATPANVASAYVTAAFGIAQQIKLLHRQEVSREDFVINCETVCLDVSVSAIASLAGQMIIPIPVLGAVIGNVTGQFVYEFCKKEGSACSQQIIKNYHQEIDELNKLLDAKYIQLVNEIVIALKQFDNLEKMAFDQDVNVSFNASIELADAIGVDAKKIIRNKNQLDGYFLT